MISLSLSIDYIDEFLVFVCLFILSSLSLLVWFMMIIVFVCFCLIESWAVDTFSTEGCQLSSWGSECLKQVVAEVERLVEEAATQTAKFASAVPHLRVDVRTHNFMIYSIVILHSIYYI